MPIHSQILDNPKAERVRRLADLARAKGRERAGRFLIEGPQAVREAVACMPGIVTDLYVAAREEPDSFVVDSEVNEAIAEVSQEADSPIYAHLATPEVMSRISSDAQGIVAVGDVAKLHEAWQRDVETLGETSEGDAPLVAAFWQVRDPGNAGTVVRAADAAGASAVVFVDDCVDPLGPKVVRATAGSLFHVPVARMGEQEFLDWVSRLGLTLVAADVHGVPGRAPESLPDLLVDRTLVRGSKAVLFGNEARGLEPAMLGNVDRVVAIPIYGKAESLNLATSAAILLMDLAMAARRP